MKGRSKGRGLGQSFLVRYGQFWVRCVRGEENGTMIPSLCLPSPIPFLDSEHAKCLGLEYFQTIYLHTLAIDNEIINYCECQVIRLYSVVYKRALAWKYILTSYAIFTFLVMQERLKMRHVETTARLHSSPKMTL